MECRTETSSPRSFGAYRPIALLERPLPFLPGGFRPAPDGSDIRFALGRALTFTGRVFIPGADPGGGDLDHRLSGDWAYDVPAQQLILDFDPSVPISPPRLVFQITFLSDRVRLEGTTEIGGVPISFDLGKPLPPEDAPTTSCPNCPAFGVVPTR